MNEVSSIIIAFCVGALFTLLFWPAQKRLPQAPAGQLSAQQSQAIIQQAIATLTEHGIHCNQATLNQMIFRLCYERAKHQEQLKVIEALSNHDAHHPAVGIAAKALEVEL